MDDLAGLDWSKSTTKKAQNPSYTYHASAFATLKPTPPTSGRVTPLNTSSQPLSKPATPANDSFSNLVSFSNSNSTANLSLQEQQKRLADLRLQQQKKQTQSLQEPFTGGDESFWNTFGSGRSTPAVESQNYGKPVPRPAVQDEDDIFAAFSASNAKPQKATKSLAQTVDDDDDPFELSKFQAQKAETVASPTNGFDEDDVLGLLGQPASARPKVEPVQEPSPRLSGDVNPQDRAVSELVDMGFPADRARQALEITGSGMDVQAAVGWLLNQAHQDARERTQGWDTGSNDHSPTAASRRRGTGRVESDRQQWQDQETEDPRRRQPTSSAEKDPTQLAAEFGNNFLKTANSLWKVGQKKVQQAVQEFNSDSESSQPKWMREPDRMAKSEARQQQRVDESGTARRRRRSSAAQSKSQQSATDEAMMLEGQRPTPPPRQPPRSRPEAQFDSSADNSRDHSPAFPSRLREAHSPQPAFLRHHQQPQKPPTPPAITSSRAGLSRQTTEDQAAQAYVSSARRRKAPTQVSVAASEPDLLEGSSKLQLSPRPASSRPAPSPQPASIAVRPSAPTRIIPSVSALTLKASHSHREKANEHFKRGDYSSAHQAYSTSLSHLPSTHPLTIVLLTNRALTALKTGEPKTAVIDSDSVISIIGISKGETETIDFADGSAAKPMRDYYGKALMRKAEALEQMENWIEAAAVWKEAVEVGHGGARSMQGRLRAEKAANPPPSKPKPKPPPTRKPPPPRPSTLLSSKAQQDSAAVSALRAANAAADRADDEKFALSDSVDARINTWKNGKQDNLRALLGSLDTVLWEGSGWKKISMADLVLPGRVKVQYMKGIGRVHPDKIPIDATTEQRMISSAVFSTLNEAWDKFRKENGL